MLRSRLPTFRRAELLRKKKRKKENVRTAFKFVKGLLNWDKGRQLKSARVEVEEYLRNIYSDLEKNRILGLALLPRVITAY